MCIICVRIFWITIIITFFAVICLEYSDIILPLLLLLGKYSALNGVKYFTKKFKVSFGAGGWGRGH